MTTKLDADRCGQSAPLCEERRADQPRARTSCGCGSEAKPRVISTALAWRGRATGPRRAPPPRQPRTPRRDLRGPVLARVHSARHPEAVHGDDLVPARVQRGVLVDRPAGLTRLEGVKQARRRAPLGGVDVDREGHEGETVAALDEVEVLGGVLGAHRDAAPAALHAPAADQRAAGGDRRAGREPPVRDRRWQPVARDTVFLVGGGQPAGDIDSGGVADALRLGVADLAGASLAQRGLPALAIVLGDHGDRSAVRRRDERRMAGAYALGIAPAADEENVAHGANSGARVALASVRQAAYRGLRRPRRSARGRARSSTSIAWRITRRSPEKALKVA